MGEAGVGKTVSSTNIHMIFIFINKNKIRQSQYNL